MSQEENSCREFYRTESEVLVRYGPDTVEARHAMAMDQDTWHIQSQLEAAARHAMDEAVLPEGMEPVMAALKWLDYKLDLVLYHLTSPKVAAFFPQHAVTSDISGSGLSLANTGDLKVGQRILLNICLSDSPSRTIYAVGEVVRVDSAEEAGEPFTAVRFEDISEEDRERIVRYNFRQQRKDLAKRAEEDGD